METVITRREIDKLKDYFSSHREELSDEELKRMENEFIEKVKIYKVLYPNHTKTIQRWRNWYRLVREDLHTNYCPKELLNTLPYALETFMVSGSERGQIALEKWFNNVLDGGYFLKKETVDKINRVLVKYGCSPINY